MLTDFFCNTFKMSSVKCISTTSMKKAMRDVATALTDTRLDNLDVAILNRLLEDESGLFGGRPAKPKPTTLIPPNMNTVVGPGGASSSSSPTTGPRTTREMMKFVQGAKKKHFVSGIRSDIINNLLRMTPGVREQVEDDRKLFYRRFYALFKWPAIMTLQGASLELQSICRSAIIEESAPIQAKRTYSRRQTGSSCVKKRILVRELPKAPPRAVPLKLTPVTNKSVIEDLMRNKNKKLFCFDKVVCGEETKTVIREIPLPHVEKNGKPEAKTKKYNVGGHDDCDECLLAHSDEEDAVSCSGSDESAADDEEDLKKLNVFLNEEVQSSDGRPERSEKVGDVLEKEKETDDMFIGESSFC
ncbi:hypothetical protein NQ318_004352 [Aromia moschata]|uniref:Uncharacterized protein n=1 Tax=Aromia moschata TaxID=1265417 RepID=A0AAV8YRG4_9CUCU|nr:hypothetical protein NQ318_004352 [Aromia moschata]